MISRQTKDGWQYVGDLSGANLGAESGEGYISAVDDAVNELVRKINSLKGILTDKSKLKGNVAEYWHAGTFNIEAALRGSKDRAHVLGSNEHASVDISTDSGQIYSLKYYATGKNSVLAQAKDVFRAYHEYLSKSKADTPMTFEQFLAKNGYSGDKAELFRSVYYGQVRIIPVDQLNDAIEFLKRKIASESAAEGENRAEVLAKYLETLSKLSDRIKNSEGVESIPLTKNEAETIAELCKKGNFDPREFGLGLESLVKPEYILQQAMRAGCTAALLTAIFQIAPYIYNAFMELIRTGEIDRESIMNGGLKTIPATAEGFLRGGIASALTIAAKSGKFGPTFTNIDAGMVGAITFLVFDTVKNSLLVAAGKMRPREMGSIFAEHAIVAAGSIIGGHLAQTLLPSLPVLGYMLGSLAGNLIASATVFTGEKMLLAFCADSGFTCFGLVEQNYELPPELLEQMGYEIAQYETIEFDTIQYETIEFETIRYETIEFDKFRDAEGFEFIPLRRGVIGFNTIGCVY